MIGIALQSGCSFSGQAFSPLQVSAGQALCSTARTEMSPFLKRILVTFRVSGKVADFDFSGIDAVKYLKAKRELKMDFGVRKDEWQGLQPFELRQFFGNALLAVLNRSILEIERRSLLPPDADVIAEIQNQISLFMNSPEEEKKVTV